ncbi:MAG: hypothetical protein ABR985_17140 [Methanotrichaceae archaeon]|jgi:hypothetical protein
MIIEPITCAKCGKKGRPGEGGFRTNGFKIDCECGNVINVDHPRDQNILSYNVYGRLRALSNHEEHGKIECIPGEYVIVSLNKLFDVISMVNITPGGGIVAEYQHQFSVPLKNDIMIMTSFTKGEIPNKEITEVYWAVFGLVDSDSLPTWYLHFYSAVSNLQRKLYRPALLDYETAFEAFMEQFLLEQLTRRYDETVAKYLLDKVSRITDRCKELLNLATGHKLSEDPKVYNPWDSNVKKKRDTLIHGTLMHIQKDDAEKAHQATYQAIRWVQKLVGQELPLEQDNIL